MKKLFVLFALLATTALAQHHYHGPKIPHRDLYVGLDIASFVLDIIAPRTTTIVAPQPVVVNPPVIQEQTYVYPTVPQTTYVVPTTTYVETPTYRYVSPYLRQPVFPRMIVPAPHMHYAPRPFPPPRPAHYPGYRPPIYHDQRHISRPPRR